MTLLQSFFSPTFLTVIVVVTVGLMVVLTYLYRRERRLWQWFFIAWVIFIVLHLIGILCVRTSVQQTRNRMIRTLNVLTDYLVFEFPSRYASLSYDISMDDPVYQEGLLFLQNMQSNMDLAATIYMIQKNRNGKIVLSFSPSLDLNRDGKIEGKLEIADPPGFPFKPDSPSVLQKIESVLSSGESAITEKYADQWGEWITVLRPWRNENGEITAVLAVDFWGEDWEQTFYFARVWPTLFYESFLIYFFFQFIILLKHRTQEKNLRYYSYELEKLVKDTERIQRQLDSADQNKREFLENVHDAIQIHIKELSRWIEQLQAARNQNKPDAQSPSLETILTNIHKTSSDLMGFLDNIHIYSTIDLLHVPTRLTSVRLKDVFRMIDLSLSEYLKRDRNLDLQVYIDDTIPDLVLIHFQYFMNIILELLNNAIHFTEAGKIEIRVSIKHPGQSQITTQFEEDKPSSVIPGYLFLDSFEEEPLSDQLPYLKITVSDSGCGISSKHMESLFKPFHKQDDKHDNKQDDKQNQNTNQDDKHNNKHNDKHNEKQKDHDSYNMSVMKFGLCTAKRLTQIIGGRIWVESHPRLGSSFSLLLPFVLPASQLVSGEYVHYENRAAPVRPLNGLRILVVDSSVANQVFITTILIEAGASTETVNNGIEAIERLQTGRQQGNFFDVILLDSHMHQMSGYQTIYNIRNRGFMRPIILMGSAFDKVTHLHPLENCALVRKPIDRQRLIQTIITLAKKETKKVEQRIVNSE
ncbi:MAG: response regulator, partial [Planctomycetaceae bacterium]|jgi:signal transduction histidine kinase/CheY-like chemotaxis protein|nr:response regulator [Planctomycetaceae bacterium]